MASQWCPNGAPMVLEASEKILLIGPAWVGDMVLAHALIRTLKHRAPDCSLHLLAPPWTLPLASRMPELATAAELPFRHGELALRKRWHLARTLRAHHYQRAIILPNSFKSALIPRFAGIPIRTGWLGEARHLLLTDPRKPDPTAFPQMVHRFVALAYPAEAVAAMTSRDVVGGEVTGEAGSKNRAGVGTGSRVAGNEVTRGDVVGSRVAGNEVTSGDVVGSSSAGNGIGGRVVGRTITGQLPILPPRLRTSDQEVNAALQALALPRPAKMLALCPGAEYGPAKQWPAPHYAKLATAMAGQGWHIWLFGSAKDQAVSAEVMAHIPARLHPRCQNLTGTTTLPQAIDLLSLSTVVASNDSGLMHIAAALNRPVVALYGSTSEHFTPPLTDKVTLLSTAIACRPCFKRECPYGHRRCLTELAPERAIRAVHALAEEPTRPPPCAS